ncbi:aldo/keto reductase [Leadbettera azotonutricia]|uniref:Morphine 6-dehydrogenase n=1 Tax=Leadbettera azotonutricia (strain ATCC BAA-888 / DSM 13862 / ZAS-9) TaxID=545695 RepID=F5Y895_LEAAZ|nr:aldo/keto reductase [Leadbettera azotonutricia]AEF81683.1 morphine 6-dehydrogenase [Leadbettera azotonutricia ZAS-9]
MELKSLTDCFSLNNGVSIPCIGFGTWQTPDGDVTVNAVKSAIDAGYRHIDTAAVYGNEISVGKGIKASGINREKIFVTSKLFNTEHTYERTKVAFNKSLKDLQLDYLDLYLIHWPNPVDFRNKWAESNVETWKAFEEFYNEGRVRAIGVSNFHAHHLDALTKSVKIMPMVNQLRLCPGDIKGEVVKASKERGLFIEAYSPLGGSGEGSLLKAPLLIELAKKYNKSVSQLCVRWCLQCGFLPLPKSTSTDHIKANANVFDFKLSEDDVDQLSHLRGYPDPFPHPDSITW